MRRIILGSSIAAALAIASAVSLIGPLASGATPIGAASPDKAPAGRPSVAADVNRPPVPIVRKPAPAAPLPDPQPGPSARQPELRPAPAPPAVTSAETDAPKQLPWADIPEAIPPGSSASMPPPATREAPPSYAMIALQDGRVVILVPERRRDLAYPVYAYEVRIDKKERHRRRGKHKDWD